MMNKLDEHSLSINSHHIFQDLNTIRMQLPIVHNISNNNTTIISESILLALGATPIMAHARCELPNIIEIAKALVINISTLDHTLIDSIKFALVLAKAKKIPVIFEPAGACTTRFRTQTACEILKSGVSIVRGNIAEIKSLAENKTNIRNLNNLENMQATAVIAKTLAQQFNCTVVINGPSDVIADKQHCVFINNISPLITKVAGMNSASTVTIAAFAAINPNYLLAAIHGMGLFNTVALLAEAKSSGPASFHNHFVDELYGVSESNINSLHINQYSNY